MPDTLKYRIAFSALKGLTIATAQEVLAVMGDEHAFFEAPESSLAAIFGRKIKAFSDRERAEALAIADRERAFIDSSPVRAIYFTDDDYPQRLAQCDDAPLMLYASGICDLNSCRSLAIVGTRHATNYGVSFISDLLSELSQRVDGLVTVSGLAYGIDITAHRESLKLGIPTVGVVAHGITTLYPAAHRNIAAQMVKGSGMVLTEYRHDTPVHRGNFLARNRIIAGLCDATLIVESAVRGGAMVTARLAGDYNRDVLALPGRVDDQYSAGCNKLIRDQRAALITCADDLIDILGWPTIIAPEEPQPLPLLTLTPEQQAIVDYLDEHGDVSVNHLTSALGLPVSHLMAALVDLEFNDMTISLPGSRYRLKKRPS